MERVGDCWTGQSSQWAVVPMEEEEVVPLKYSKTLTNNK